jgi:hypothetical protein
MTAAAHTPGPWEVLRALHPSDGGWDWGIGAQLGGENDPKLFCIAEVFDVVDRGKNAPAEANARLIAAAPDMLALLQELWADPRVVSHSTGPSEEWLLRARATINRATGKPWRGR